MRLSVCGAGAIGTACADDAHAKARTKATAVNRIMEILPWSGWFRTDLPRDRIVAAARFLSRI
jgi:hypothetical protein